MAGTFTLDYGAGTLEVAWVTTVNESMQKSCTVIPLVSMHVDDTFAVESRSSKTINISFERNNSDWSMSNAEWIGEIRDAMDRWQCKTDGFTASYIPGADNPYVSPFSFNGYVKSFIYRAEAGNPEVIKGTIEFHVGTMYSGSQPRTSLSQDASQFSVEMSTADGGTSYPLVGNDMNINCVESYTLCGGPESPFEYLTMTVPRNRLTELAPALTAENGIVAGRNRLIVRAVGHSDMTVTKCKLRDNKFTITAYCDADRLRGYTLGAAITDTPALIITTILSGNVYGVNFTGDSLVMIYDTSIDVGEVSFSADKNVWYVLQVCAMLLRCRIFFANNKAYIIDYTLEGDYAGLDTVDGPIDLYTVGSDDSMVAGTVTLGDEGIDTVVNKVKLRVIQSVLDENGAPKYDKLSDVDQNNLPSGAVIKGDYVVYNEVVDYTVTDTEGSIQVYGGERTATVSVTDLTQLSPITVVVEEENPETGEMEETSVTIQNGTDQGETFGKNLIAYRNEPQQSIEFTVKETHRVGSNQFWYAEYLPAARASQINDVADDVVISNISDLTGLPKPQKLCLSTFERHFPQGTTTYTWGVMASIDLSSSTSQINTTLDNS